MAWTIRLITALISLGFSPKREEKGSDFAESPEYKVCIKTIEIIKMTLDLHVNQSQKTTELLDMAILSFISTFRSNVIADSRIVAKVMENNHDNGILKFEGFIKVAYTLSSKDILEIVDIFLNKMIITFFSNSEVLITQDLEMLKTFVSSPVTQKYLMTLDTTEDLMKNHFTKYVFLNQGDMLEHLSGFYRILTIFWEVNDGIEKFGKYMEPISLFLESMLSSDPSDFVNARPDILRTFYILSGISQGFTSAEPYNNFFEWFYPNNFKIIQEGLKNFSEDKVMLKGVFILMRDLLENKSQRLKADSCYLNGFILFKEIANIQIDFFKYVNMYEGYKIK